MSHIGHYIDGNLTEGASGRLQDVFNPATGEVSHQVALADMNEVNQAVASAKAAWPAWAAFPVLRRARIMDKRMMMRLARSHEALRWLNLQPLPPLL